MLRIRSEQVAALRAAAAAQFEERMIRHVKEVWPEECAARGPEGVAATVYLGVVRSRTYGLRAEYDVGRYIDLMFAFGNDFDRAGATPWAGPTLTDSRLSPRQRMDTLWGRAERELRARGEEG